jgi:glycosyltransferase involved in cell wall biosynthesis
VTVRFSLVVPAYNEERYLPRLLDSVGAARAAYGGGPSQVETIVADNASTDATEAIALERGCRVARVEKRAIAAARNGGAALASGELLAFVDADTRIHPATFDRIDAVLQPHVVAGATGVRPERWSAGFAATWALFLPFVWLTRMDTGVVFCRRADFAAVGGYDERLLFGEDVDFLLRLRRLGRSRGQGLARMSGAKAIASMRKFDEHGEWHYLTAMPRVAVGWLLRRQTGRAFADRYWYRPSR